MSNDDPLNLLDHIKINPDVAFIRTFTKIAEGYNDCNPDIYSDGEDFLTDLANCIDETLYTLGILEQGERPEPDFLAPVYDLLERNGYTTSWDWEDDR